MSMKKLMVKINDRLNLGSLLTRDADSTISTSLDARQVNDACGNCNRREECHGCQSCQSAK